MPEPNVDARCTQVTYQLRCASCVAESFQTSYFSFGMSQPLLVRIPDGWISVSDGDMQYFVCDRHEITITDKAKDG